MPATSLSLATVGVWHWSRFRYFFGGEVVGSGGSVPGPEPVAWWVWCETQKDLGAISDTLVLGGPCRRWVLWTPWGSELRRQLGPLAQRGAVGLPAAAVGGQAGGRVLAADLPAAAGPGGGGGPRCLCPWPPRGEPPPVSRVQGLPPKQCPVRD